MRLRLAPARIVLAGASVVLACVAPACFALARVIVVMACVTPAGAGAAAPQPDVRLRLAVPVLAQAPERCGPAALAMVLRFYGAPDSALAEVERAHSAAFAGALITDLARAAERAGFAARVATLTEDSLFAMLRDSVPPILHYGSGARPLMRGHYGVLVGWDPVRREHLVNDGRARTARYRHDDLMRRWKAAGSLALIVWRRTP